MKSPLVKNNAKIQVPELETYLHSAFAKLMILKSQYRRIANDNPTNDKSAGYSRNRRRQLKNFHKAKRMLRNQSQDSGLRAISKIFDR